MGVTDLGHPFPEGPDDVDVPGDIEALAQSVDGKTYVRQAKKSIIPAAQTRTANTYDFLGTPDKVTGIVLPTDALLFVAFQAQWKQNSGGDSPSAAVFLGANEVKANSGGGGPLSVASNSPLAVGSYVPLASFPGGLYSSTSNPGGGGSDATTGQLVGEVDDGKFGAMAIFAAAGTYDVGVKFKCANGIGPVTVKERKLWVWSMAFA